MEELEKAWHAPTNSYPERVRKKNLFLPFPPTRKNPGYATNDTAPPMTDVTSEINSYSQNIDTSQKDRLRQAAEFEPTTFRSQ